MRTKTIDELVENALALCREQGFTEASIYAKHKVFKAIIRKHKENMAVTPTMLICLQNTRLRRRTAMNMAD